MTVLVFGSTGSAGGSVLRACLAAPAVTQVRVISRRPVDLEHGKLRVWIHADFQNFDAVADAFSGVDACCYGLGVSAAQVPDETTYRTITHDFAVAAARALQAKSPAAIFHFISGQGARLDSRLMWARVKAETENDLMALVEAICWRPAFIDGEHADRAPHVYQAIRALARLLSPFKGLYVTGDDLGRAMLQATADEMPGRVIENDEIRALAERSRAGTAI